MCGGELVLDNINRVAFNTINELMNFLQFQIPIRKHTMIHNERAEEGNLVLMVWLCRFICV